MSKNLSQKLLLICGLLFLSSAIVRSQVTTNSGSGLAATYPSLDAAITALNAATITSPVVITLTASNPQTAPSGGYTITKEGTSTNTITLVGNNNTITASNAQAAGNLTDALFKLIGADNVTITGFNLIENSANTVTDGLTNNMTEFGVALFHATTTNGAQNNTISNCTIHLTRTYQNSFGIFSHANISNTDVIGTTNAAGAGGNNNGLTITGNTITDVNMGIVCFGGSSAGNENDGLVIGGTTTALGNNISNFGGSIASSAYLNLTSTTVNGIYIRFVKNFNIVNNTITSNSAAGILGSGLHGIYVAGFSSQPVEPSIGVLNAINNNTISLQSSGATTSILGIRIDAPSPTTIAFTNTELQINNNSINTLSHVVAASGPITGITNSMAALVQSINNNKFVNLTTNTTGSVTLISNSVTIPATGIQSVSDNSIVTGFSKTGDGGTVTGFITGGSSITGTTVTQTNNNFSNITVVGATVVEVWRNRDGLSTVSGPTKTIANNIFSNITGGTGSITGLIVNASSPTSTISNNKISNISSAGLIVGISIISNENGNFFKNTINSLSSTGSSATVVTVIGINFTGTASTNSPKVYQNKIYDLMANNAAGSVSGMLVGYLGTGATVSIYNNLIGDLRAPITNNDGSAATGSDAVRGINITSTTTLANIKVYFNTIYINASSSGANFSTAGIYHTQNATATTAALDLRNNIIINTSTATGGGASAAAFRRSAAGLDNYAVTSNNNMFYAGTPSVTNNIYNNGTAYQTLTDFQTLVTARETASKTENTVPGFVSTSGANVGFLHIRPGTITVCESKAGAGTGITDDFDGDTRSGLPDIGADEFAGVVPITLSSFTGAKQALGNLLSWTTATELNNTGFELQRSADGVNFSALVFVPSKADNGNSNSNLSYSFVDKKSLATGYYRLKQIDKDGKSSLSAIVLLKGNKASGIELTSIYPNPAINNLNIVIASSKTANLSLLISDLSGKIILRQQASIVDGDNAVKINVSTLAKGTYTIKAICNDGCETAISKFIKQ